MFYEAYLNQVWSLGWKRGIQAEITNTSYFYSSPAEPWGPVCSPGCWTPWSSHRHYRSQPLQNCKGEKHRNKRQWNFKKTDFIFSSGVIFLSRRGLIYVSDAMVLTCLGRGSFPGRCGPPGCSSQLLCIWEYSSGWTPERRESQCSLNSRFNWR